MPVAKAPEASVAQTCLIFHSPTGSATLFPHYSLFSVSFSRILFQHLNVHTCPPPPPDGVDTYLDEEGSKQPLNGCLNGLGAILRTGISVLHCIYGQAHQWCMALHTWIAVILEHSGWGRGHHKKFLQPFQLRVEPLFSGFFGTDVFGGPQCRIGCL